MALEIGSAADDNSNENHTVVEWLPPELERLRASRLVHRSFEETEKILSRRPDEIVRLAYGDDGTERTGVIHLAAHPLIPWVRVPVRVETFTPTDIHNGAVISIRWTPIRFGALVPTMDADLVVRPHLGEVSELELEGRYRPPLGLVGLIVDRAVGRFVAGATAKTFLDLFAEAIETSRTIA